MLLAHIAQWYQPDTNYLDTKKDSPEPIINGVGI